MSKYNLKSIIVGLIVLVVGVFLALMDTFVWKSPSSLLLNIGCSLVASSLVILLTTFLVDMKKLSPLDEWGISKIYSTRSEKNADSDPELERVKYKIDAVAFGLSNFRSKYTSKVEVCLRKGVNIRILTMDPDSELVHIREKEENAVQGQIEKSIRDLVEWANKLNSENRNKGKIIIKGYSCMTLDFYWRVDDELFIGPYWYGQPSNQTITYAFKEGGKGFAQYTTYFENLWESKENVKALTTVTEITAKKSRKKSRC